jgi:glycerophosphoryl diester phosphodiesterase
MKPIVIGHRGACGEVPEHTLVSYFLAAQQGADYLEPDLVMTRDGVLVARHENEIGSTTDVAQRREFASRKTAKRVSDQQIEGWFVEDFTLAELKTLRARERLAELRPHNSRFDGQFEIPTFDEIMALVQSLNQQRVEAARQLALKAGVEYCRPPRIGIYPETKHPGYFTSINLSLEPALLSTLARWNYAGPDAPVFIQSFESHNLRHLREQTHLPLVQLLDAEVSDARLQDIASYADIIGVHKDLLIPRSAENQLAQPTDLTKRAQACGLKVHAWTFRAENHFLPLEYRRGAAAERGDMQGEVQAFLQLGIAGVFTDHPAQLYSSS